MIHYLIMLSESRLNYIKMLYQSLAISDVSFLISATYFVISEFYFPNCLNNLILEVHEKKFKFGPMIIEKWIEISITVANSVSSILK